MILAIDPSFTSTGIAVLENGNVCFRTHITSGIKIYESIINCQLASECILSNIKRIFDEYQINEVIVEYPVLSSISGSYLAVLHGYLAQFLNSLNIDVYYIPPMACDSYTRNVNHLKSFLVNFVKNNYNLQGRINNDEATAIILAHILIDFKQGKYKNKVFKYGKEGIRN